MTEKLTKLLHELSEEIKIDDSVLKYQKARENYLDDMKLMALITEYNSLQNKMEEEAAKENGDSKAITDMNAKSEELRKDIFANPTYVALQEAEEDINVMLATINGEITQSITSEQQHSCCIGSYSGNCTHCH